jgi:hypothetical protein
MEANFLAKWFVHRLQTFLKIIVLLDVIVNLDSIIIDGLYKIKMRLYLQSGVDKHILEIPLILIN